MRTEIRIWTKLRQADILIKNHAHKFSLASYSDWVYCITVHLTEKRDLAKEDLCVSDPFCLLLPSPWVTRSQVMHKCLCCKVAQLAFPKATLHMPSRHVCMPVDRQLLTHLWTIPSVTVGISGDKTFTALSSSWPQMLCQRAHRSLNAGQALQGEQDAPGPAAEAAGIQRAPRGTLGS